MIRQDFAFHVSDRRNRESIRAHGLDASRMETVTGIAGSAIPELEGVFLARDFEEAEWFASWEVYEKREFDIWRVETVGLDLEENSDGWLVYAGDIPPERVELVTGQRPWQSGRSRP